MVDKSSTHVLVERNGIQNWMNKTVWEAIGTTSNKDGWSLVAREPKEVVQMKSKRAEEIKEKEEELVSEELEVKELKSKKSKKAK